MPYDPNAMGTKGSKTVDDGRAHRVFCKNTEMTLKVGNLIDREVHEQLHLGRTHSPSLSWPPDPPGARLRPISWS